MFSRPNSSFLGLASDSMLGFPQSPRNLPRVLTVPGIIPDIERNVAPVEDSEFSSPSCHMKKIIVANFLPVKASRDTTTLKWCFSLDEDALLLQMRDGFSPDTKVVYIGSLKVDVDSGEQDEISQVLLEKFNCVPTFIPSDVREKYYHGFCKQQLWPLFHYMLPIWPDHSTRYDPLLWQAYVSANKIYADKIMEVLNPEDDYVWIHDYHLMILPTFLRRRFNRIKLGFFLHSPFPSSEIYRTLPVRDEILKGLLNTDLIGFQTFDYARHFLSCCSGMLGIDYELKRGYIGLDYFGRTVYIKILPVGVHMGQLQMTLNHPSMSSMVKEIQEKFKCKKLILGIDDMDIFKGISLKLLAMEQLLRQNPKLIGEIVLVQIVNPARSTGKDVEEARRETYSITNRINEVYGSLDYQPVVLIDREVPFYEKTAFYALAECCIVNAVRDGMNLVPYKYIVCREGTRKLHEILGISPESPHTSTLVVSEFVGCSPSLSGAIRVNPWDIDAVADALNQAIVMLESEKQLRHEKHYRYVSSHDVAYWARSFVQGLERACRTHYSKRCWGMGFGLGFRVLALSPSFRKLSLEHITSAYMRTARRAVFLDYDGTIVPETSLNKVPSPEVISILNRLCIDPNNTVFIVSGRAKDPLSDWFAECHSLGIAAEHGYFTRWNKLQTWDVSPIAADLDWKVSAEPVMKLYTETTDGSFIETKESAIVWNHQYADPDFGFRQAKELLDHLESVLANEPVIVKRGQYIVEVKPQGISKGVAAQKVLSTMISNGEAPDFVLCIGDDRSDEDMFESILSTKYSASLPTTPEIFACTVGQKPSKAKYYLDDTMDVVKLLQGLANSSVPKPPFRCSEVQVSFGSSP